MAAAKWVKEKNLEMKWQFVVERRPWWGGAWERLVGIVKEVLDLVRSLAPEEFEISLSSL